ncbi:uncharacterized protein LOC143704262 [Siphateles boraxobius]|uniref:uncharacterized protein LOC143704262 n=1 Tax=Siphateles boraxobius TaxID=180520 RepID=UPI00406411F2
MNISTENFNSTEVHPSTIIQGPLILMGFRTGLLCFCLLFGVPTHSYVLWLIARGKRIPLEIFNVNLTVCEIIYCLIFLIYIFQIFLNVEIVQHFLQGIGITGRPLFQCLMCMERYLAVVHPVTFLKFKPLRYRVICCTAVWITTLGSCLVSLIILTLSNLKAFTWFFSLQFLIYISIQLFCLVTVLRALKQSGPGGKGGGREEENHMKRKAFHLILITTVTLVVMFAPFIFTGFLTILQQQKQQGVSLIWFLSLSCFILAGFVQPVLYLHRVSEVPILKRIPQQTSAQQSKWHCITKVWTWRKIRAAPVPFFLEVHEELNRTWTAPYSARSRPCGSILLATLDGGAAKGYVDVPPVKRAIAMQLCPASASSWRCNPRLQSKACKFFSSLTAKAYRACGQAASALHAMALLQVHQAQALLDMHEGGSDPGAPCGN